MDSPVYLERRGRALRLVLNRPDKRNALTRAMWRAIPELVAEAENDASARLLVVTGAGGTFAAGADIDELVALQADESQAAAYAQDVSAALDALAAFSKPSLALIEGACVGGGCAVALACDLRFAQRGARFAVTPAKLGLVYPLSDTRRLVEAVGLARARDMLFTARMLSDEEALGAGLIDRLVDPGALEAEERAFAETIAANSPRSMRLTKQVMARIQAGQTMDDETTQGWFVDAVGGDDFKEGCRAFLDERKPDFDQS